MIKWYFDKKSKIPLYLQLRDLIKYYISTGIIRNNEQLPGVVRLSKELKVNFETVRKAYKELEKEGLISINRGKGSFAVLPQGTVLPRIKESFPSDVVLSPETSLKNILGKMWQQGKTEKEIKILVYKILRELSQEKPKPFVIFAECNQAQANEISQLLEDQLKIKVKPVLVNQLQEELNKLPSPELSVLAIVTTGFHLNEVRKIVANLPIDIHILISQMSPETWSKLTSLSKDTRLGFICKDRETIILYEDLLRAELGEDIHLATCLMEEEDKIREIVKSVDVILVTPAAYEKVRKFAPKDIQIFNVFDRVDPLTLKIVQSAIAQKLKSNEALTA